MHTTDFFKRNYNKNTKKRGWTEMNTWEANIRKVVPYTPGEQPNQPDMIKLNTNENPYPPAPGVEKALHGFSQIPSAFIRTSQLATWYTQLPVTMG